MAEVRAIKKKRYTGGVLDIQAGHDNVNGRFTVHEVVIEESSKFFKSAVDQIRNSHVDRVISLPDHSPEMVCAYIDWLYHDKINKKDNIPDGIGRGYASVYEYDHLANLYIYGEKIQDDSFCNAIISQFCTLMDDKNFGYWPIARSTADIIFNRTAADSPIRRMMVDVWMTYSTSEWVLSPHGGRRTTNAELMKELAYAFIERRQVIYMVRPGVYEQRGKWFKGQGGAAHG